MHVLAALQHSVLAKAALRAVYEDGRAPDLMVFVLVRLKATLINKFAINILCSQLDSGQAPVGRPPSSANVHFRQ
jgi:hypothetical protein